jgi:hypothetical protein
MSAVRGARPGNPNGGEEVMKRRTRKMGAAALALVLSAVAVGGASANTTLASSLTASDLQLESTGPANKEVAGVPALVALGAVCSLAGAFAAGVVVGALEEYIGYQPAPNADVDDELARAQIAEALLD